MKNYKKKYLSKGTFCLLFFSFCLRLFSPVSNLTILARPKSQPCDKLNKMKPRRIHAVNSLSRHSEENQEHADTEVKTVRLNSIKKLNLGHSHRWLKDHLVSIIYQNENSQVFPPPLSTERIRYPRDKAKEFNPQMILFYFQFYCGIIDRYM